MSQLANLKNLRHLQLEQNTGITGPLADANPATSLGLCSVVQVCQGCRLFQDPVLIYECFALLNFVPLAS